MEVWIKSMKIQLKKILKEGKGPVRVVLGNEACDLDSGVCALSLAYHYRKTKPCFPVLNIVAKDFMLKTELVHCLNKINVRQDDLIFRDDIDLKSFKDLELILVDHNVLSANDKDLEKKVIEVFDHHALERELSTNTRLTVDMVGSCSTLIAEEILRDCPEDEVVDECCLRLLLAAIILDTVNLKPEAKKVTPRDLQMVDQLEKRLGPLDRSNIFEELQAVKNKIDHFTPLQLLRRDLKFVSSDKVKVGLSSVPLLAQSFSQMKEASEAIHQFGEEENLDSVLVLGFAVSQDSEMSRDLLIVDINNSDLTSRISADLEGSDSLGLRPDSVGMDRLDSYFKQDNVAASRKQILPLVKKTVAK